MVRSAARRLAALSLALGLATGVSTARSSGCALEVDPSWSFKDADLPFAVTVTGEGTPVIVGAEYFGGKGSPLALRWDGSAWATEPVPVVTEGALVTLHDVTPFGRDEVLAVGTLRTNRTEIVRRTGSAWERMNSPESGDENGQLLGVDARAADDAWAVGKYIVEGRNSPLVLRWNGMAWKAIPAPHPEEADSAVLKDVVALGPRDAVAVGWGVADGGRHFPLIQHWNGVAWEVVPVPDPGGDAMLMGVDAFAANDIWAVGWTADEAGDTASLALHWDGRSWLETNLPETEGRGRLMGVTATSEGGMLAVGDVKDMQGRYAPLAFTWDWSGWGPVPLPAIDTHDAFLASAAAPAPGQVLLVGTHRGPDGFGSLLLRGCTEVEPA
jgi:hypothetical protein